VQFEWPVANSGAVLLRKLTSLRMMAREDCVLSFRTSGPNYRTKQIASGDARDP